MRELTRVEKLIMWLEIKLCRHEYMEISVPYGWEYMQGSLICGKCSYSIPIQVKIEQADVKL